ncbi:MAG: RagB/SusD family nutrient uptake outer membrane protein [Dysgonamonadaceae bacterium]|jgi:hypothetical protein|nr:RagB/SusD family nutrient uptake outer membrane protein [Dysgonamonadaceae bacterium]
MKTYLNKFKKYLLLVPLLAAVSCSDFLDVVPDDFPTLDDAFKNRAEAQKFLVGLYSFMPDHGNTEANPALVGGDEVWFFDNSSGINLSLWRKIPFGKNDPQDPSPNYFTAKSFGKDGNVNGGKALFTALRDCNIFLAKSEEPYDLYQDERNYWIAQVQFLKAYYHFWLMRMYGPIPVIRDVNVELHDDDDLKMQIREPIDTVVHYICNWLDAAAAIMEDTTLMVVRNEAGKPDRVICLALKAEVLTYAASPLFNGNEEARQAPGYSGTDLFPEYKAAKWDTAAYWLNIAIQEAEAKGRKLYNFRDAHPTEILDISLVNDTIINASQVRGAVTHKWEYNTEIIWGDQRRCDKIHEANIPVLGSANVQSMGWGQLKHNYAPTLSLVEQFYTGHGIPIEDDKDWYQLSADTAGLYKRKQFDGRAFMPAATNPVVAAGLNRYTAALHFDREPRFYGAILYPFSLYYGALPGFVANTSSVPAGMWVTWNGNFNLNIVERFPATGYMVQKLAAIDSYYEIANAITVQNIISGALLERYPFPIIRLADLYLMYAEALNEIGNDGNFDNDATELANSAAYYWIDSVRARTGLEGVVESWETYGKDATTKAKPLNRAGLREIIHRERLNEFAFEGVRFWDIRRWKELSKYYDKPVRGANPALDHLRQPDIPDDYYIPQNLYQIQWGEKDYFFPINIQALINNTKLLQSPYWKGVN